MASVWICPRCKRQFTRTNQRHACGTGDRARVLANRPREVVDLYEALESFVRTFGRVEFVMRERYVLLRTDRIFTDLVIQPDAVRIAIHLPRKAESVLFIKVAVGPRHVTHVARIREIADIETLKPLIREAYEHSKRE
jgi:predicted transport protein